MHLVSTVDGKLAEDCDHLDALVACFPAGTVSGAPKIRAMQILSELEPTRREIYAGAIGYLDFAGNLDFCIAIRTIIIRNGRAAHPGGRRHRRRLEPRGRVPRKRGTRRGRCCRRSPWRKRDCDSAHRQLRLVHVQPGPVPRRARSAAGREAQRRDHGGRCRGHAAGSDRHLAWAGTAGGRRHLGRGDQALRRRACRCSASVSDIRASASPSAARWCGPRR